MAIFSFILSLLGSFYTWLVFLAGMLAKTIFTRIITAAFWTWIVLGPRDRVHAYLYRCCLKADTPKDPKNKEATRKQFTADVMKIGIADPQHFSGQHHPRVQELESSGYIARQPHSTHSKFRQISGVFIIDYINNSTFRRLYAGIVALRFRSLITVQGFSFDGDLEHAAMIWNLSPMELFHLFAFMTANSYGSLTYGGSDRRVHIKVGSQIQHISWLALLGKVINYIVFPGQLVKA